MSTLSGHTIVLSPESMDALRAVSIGDQYAKARRGASRAGRTRSLQSLQKRGLIDHSRVGYGFSLTDKGRELLTDETKTLISENNT